MVSVNLVLAGVLEGIGGAERDLCIHEARMGSANLLLLLMPLPASREDNARDLGYGDVELIHGVSHQIDAILQGSGGELITTAMAMSRPTPTDLGLIPRVLLRCVPDDCRVSEVCEAQGIR